VGFSVSFSLRVYSCCPPSERLRPYQRSFFLSFDPSRHLGDLEQACPATLVDREGSCLGLPPRDGLDEAIFHADQGNLAAAGCSSQHHPPLARPLGFEKKSKDTRGAFKPIEPWALSMAGWNVIALVPLAGIWVAAALHKA
jgi:hypothetical protein